MCHFYSSSSRERFLFHKVQPVIMPYFANHDRDSTVDCNLFFFVSLLLSSSSRKRFLRSTTFRTNRGHRCLPFSPPVLAYIFIAHRVQHSHFSVFMLVDLHRISQTHALALSTCRFVRVPCEVRNCALDPKSCAAY